MVSFRIPIRNHLYPTFKFSATKFLLLFPPIYLYVFLEPFSEITNMMFNNNNDDDDDDEDGNNSRLRRRRRKRKR